jgi:pimeloyl-ACP methyl ester carboxylesterase
MVVFSHGFGTERSSMGMFSDIVAALPDTVGYILFDYYDIVGDTWNIRPISEMASMLHSVLDFASKLSSRVVLVAHSQGCSVAAMAMAAGKVMPEKVFLLAPPTRTIPADYKHFFVSARAGRAHIDENGAVQIIRKFDRQKLVIPDAWFVEMYTMPFFDNMEKLCHKSVVRLIEATNDKSIKDRRKYARLGKAGADWDKIPCGHNFEPPHRDTLVQIISERI